MYQIGVVCTIKQLLKADDNTIRVLIEGKYRAKLVRILSVAPFPLSDVRRMPRTSRKKFYGRDRRIDALCQNPVSKLLRCASKCFAGACIARTVKGRSGRALYRYCAESSVPMRISRRCLRKPARMQRLKSWRKCWIMSARF